MDQEMYDRWVRITKNTDDSAYSFDAVDDAAISILKEEIESQKRSTPRPKRTKNTILLYK